jgi:opacity protein-like surface antigen
MRVAGFLLVALASLGVPAAVSGQDVGQKGITMGYPESIGLLWHVTEKVAVRPEFSFAHSSTDTNLPFIDNNISSTTVSVGVSALYYLSNADGLRPYVAPRWMYGHTGPGGGTTSHINSLGGAFGAQYALGKRFSVFGETGLTYSHATAKTDVAPLGIVDSLTTHSNTIGLHTGAGVIFYF